MLKFLFKVGLALSLAFLGTNRLSANDGCPCGATCACPTCECAGRPTVIDLAKGQTSIDLLVTGQVVAGPKFRQRKVCVNGVCSVVNEPVQSVAPKSALDTAISSATEDIKCTVRQSVGEAAQSLKQSSGRKHRIRAFLGRHHRR